MASCRWAHSRVPPPTRQKLNGWQEWIPDLARLHNWRELLAEVRSSLGSETAARRVSGRPVLLAGRLPRLRSSMRSYEHHLGGNTRFVCRCLCQQSGAHFQPAQKLSALGPFEGDGHAQLEAVPRAAWAAPVLSSAACQRHLRLELGLPSPRICLALTQHGKDIYEVLH